MQKSLFLSQTWEISMATRKAQLCIPLNSMTNVLYFGLLLHNVAQTNTPWGVGLGWGGSAFLRRSSAETLWAPDEREDSRPVYGLQQRPEWGCSQSTRAYCSGSEWVLAIAPLVLLAKSVQSLSWNIDCSFTFVFRRESPSAGCSNFNFRKLKARISPSVFSYDSIGFASFETAASFVSQKQRTYAKC